MHKYDIQLIEDAFFNHDSDGSESSDKEYKERKKQWASFKKYLKENTYEVRPFRSKCKNDIPPITSHYIVFESIVEDDKDKESNK